MEREIFPFRCVAVSLPGAEDCRGLSQIKIYRDLPEMLRIALQAGISVYFFILGFLGFCFLLIRYRNRNFFTNFNLPAPAVSLSIKLVSAGRRDILPDALR